MLHVVGVPKRMQDSLNNCKGRKIEKNEVSERGGCGQGGDVTAVVPKSQYCKVLVYSLIIQPHFSVFVQYLLLYRMTNFFKFVLKSLFFPIANNSRNLNYLKLKNGVETPVYTSAGTGWKRQYTQVPRRGGTADIHKVPGRGGNGSIHKYRDGVETPIYTSAGTGWNRQYTESRYLKESTLFTLQGFSIVKFHPPKLRKFHPP